MYRPCRSDVESYKITVTQEKVALQYQGKSPSYYNTNIMLPEIPFINDKYIQDGIEWRDGDVRGKSSYKYSFSQIVKENNYLKLVDSENSRNCQCFI